jgi:hypothetical protein
MVFLMKYVFELRISGALSLHWRGLVNYTFAINYLTRLSPLIVLVDSRLKNIEIGGVPLNYISYIGSLRLMMSSTSPKSTTIAHWADNI